MITVQGEWVVHVAPVGNAVQCDRHGSRPQWLHQMRSDLGRLDPVAKILQIGSPLNHTVAALGAAVLAVIYPGKTQGERPMRILSAAAVMVLLTAPAYAQMATPNINLIPELASKTPEEKEQDAIKDKAYRESLKKIPDAKVSSDPWGTVRTETPKANAAPAKPKTKTGSSAQRSQ